MISQGLAAMARLRSQGLAAMAQFRVFCSQNLHGKHRENIMKTRQHQPFSELGHCGRNKQYWPEYSPLRLLGYGRWFMIDSFLRFISVYILSSPPIFRGGVSTFRKSLLGGGGVRNFSIFQGGLTFRGGLYFLGGVCKILAYNLKLSKCYHFFQLRWFLFYNFCNIFQVILYIVHN